MDDQMTNGDATLGETLIVVGNEKGGVSKSTTNMHLCVALLKRGVSVGVIDLDPRQRSLMRYVEQRRAFADARGAALELPETAEFKLDVHQNIAIRDAHNLGRFRDAVATLFESCRVVLVDCPGANVYLARVAHMLADILVTPVGASLMDFDLLAKYDAQTQTYSGMSHYAKSVWEARSLRAARNMPNAEWHVILNRFSPDTAPESHRVLPHLRVLSEKLSFTTSLGLAERPIYRDLFEHGLTVLDLDPPDHPTRAAHHVAACAEVNALLDRLAIPALMEDAA